MSSDICFSSRPPYILLLNISEYIKYNLFYVCEYLACVYIVYIYLKFACLYIINIKAAWHIYIYAAACILDFIPSVSPASVAPLNNPHPSPVQIFTYRFHERWECYLLSLTPRDRPPENCMGSSSESLLAEEGIPSLIPANSAPRAACSGSVWPT